MPPQPSLLEIFLVALRLGCTSFGGPVAHLAFFHREYVEKRRWLDEAHYADLVALCQFLPGPASSQTGFGVGYLQRGLIGGLAAWLGFTLPSAVLMIAFAHGVGSLGNLAAAGWLHGLKIAAFAVVAQAVWTMSRTLCPDWPRRIMALAAAALVLWLPWTGSQIAVIAAGAMAGWILFGQAAASEAMSSVQAAAQSTRPVKGGMVCLLLFALLLIGLPANVRITNIPALAVFDGFYRAGALVFGGGHVVLPLLEHTVVTPGWVTPDQFLAGYGAAQAVPGPLFTFSAYLGAVMSAGPGGIPGGLLALFAIFLPALLLVAGALPWWQAGRAQPGIRAAMRGANASVVGLLLAALYHPIGTNALTDVTSGALALIGCFALQSGRIPAWLLVPALAGLGAAIW